MSYDVRAIANLVLDLAEERGRAISNLSINKIVFFLHAYFLARFDIVESRTVLNSELILRPLSKSLLLRARRRGESKISSWLRFFSNTMGFANILHQIRSGLIRNTFVSLEMLSSLSRRFRSSAKRENSFQYLFAGGQQILWCHSSAGS